MKLNLFFIPVYLVILGFPRMLYGETNELLNKEGFSGLPVIAEGGFGIGTWYLPPLQPGLDTVYLKSEPTAVLIDLSLGMNLHNMILGIYLELGGIIDSRNEISNSIGISGIKLGYQASLCKDKFSILPYISECFYDENIAVYNSSEYVQRHLLFLEEEYYQCLGYGANLILKLFKDSGWQINLNYLGAYGEEEGHFLDRIVIGLKREPTIETFSWGIEFKTLLKDGKCKLFGLSPVVFFGK